MSILTCGPEVTVELPKHLGTVLEEENLPLTNSLASIRWIKPPTCHSPQQRKAFALLQVADAHTANTLLRDGLCIKTEHITIQKDKKEPICCAKCQRYGHVARSCSDATDTSDTCGAQHRTTQRFLTSVAQLGLSSYKKQG